MTDRGRPIRHRRRHDPDGQSELPPNALEAEQAVLGCALLAAQDCMGECIEKLKAGPSSFYDVRHQTLYSTLVEMHEEKAHVDLITVQQRLKDRGQLEDAGGRGYLAELPDKVASPAMVGTYLAVVWDKYLLRKIAALCSRVGREAESARPSALIAELWDQVVSIEALSGASKPSGLPPIVGAGDLIAEKPPEPTELVEGVLHQGSKLVLGGTSKSNKTFALIDLALSVAHDRPWLNFRTRKGRVLYLNLEVAQWSFAKRLEAVASAKGIDTRSEPQAVQVWTLRDHVSGWDALLPQIRKTLSGQSYALLILDPIYKLLGDLDENSAGDMGRLMNEVGRLASSTGAAVAFGAHFAKGNAAGKEAMDRISGSGVFARDPDALLVLTPHAQEGCFVVESRLRDHAPVEPFAVRWKFPLLSPDASLNPADLKQPKMGRKRENGVEMLLPLLKAPMTTSELQQAAHAEAGITRPTFFRLLKEAEQTGHIRRNGNGQLCRSIKSITTPL